MDTAYRMAPYTILSGILLLGFLLPHTASAVTIHNTVESSSRTGGQVVHGTPGSDGADGEDGRDGQDGADGANGTNGSSGTASVHIQTIVNGEVVTDVHETRTDDEVFVSVSDSPELHEEDVTVSTDASAYASPVVLSGSPFGSLTSIRLMLLTYATHLI